MLVVFRADADSAIGGGHVMRCLTLAAEMEERGADVIFLCKAGTTDTVPALGRSGFTCLATDRTDWNEAIVAGKLGGRQVDLIVIDSYRLGETFERSLRRHSCPILVIDDAPNRRHECDLLVDMTVNRVATDYAGWIPPHCRVLAGASYTLLRNAFGDLRARSLARRQAVRAIESVYVSLGLTDFGGQTGAVARSLAVAADNCVERIIVVTGPAAPSLGEIIALQNETSRIQLHIDPPDIAQLMAAADIAIGTPGTSSWERCCLGLPSILLVVAENQLDNARALEQAGAARVLPIGSDPASRVLDALRQLGAAPDMLAQMSRRAAEICDGDGAFRVGTAVDELVFPKRAGQLTLRKAAVEDSRRLWLWRNERGARAVSGDTQPVPWETHLAWLASRLDDVSSLIFIVEADGRPCGTVRFHTELTGTAVISIAMARHVRGHGYGAAALDLACRQVFKLMPCKRIEAKVKRENFASQRVFLKAGFKPAGQDADFYVYELLRL